MKIVIDIPQKRFNKLHEYAGECIYPTDKKTIYEMNLYVAILLAELGVDAYGGFDNSYFYDWIGKKIRTKFKLKEYED
jgi:hypothetical protein